MRRAQSVIAAIISLAFLAYRGYQMTLDTSDGLTVQQNQAIAWGLVATLVITGVWWTLAWTRHARAAARRLRREHPGRQILVVRGDDYLLGSIAQLRPDIANPMGLGRWQAFAVLDDRFELWGGTDGAELLLRVPWSFVRSVTVDDVKEYTYAAKVAGLIIVLDGAEITPLRFALHMRGIAIQYTIGLDATDLIASSINALRTRLPDVGAGKTVAGTGAP